MADLAAFRRRARLAAHRQEADDYLTAAEERMARLLRAAMTRAFAPALDRFGLIADAAEVPDEADLHSIRAVWAVEVTNTIVPLVVELYDTGTLVGLLSAGPAALDAALADEALDAIEPVLNRMAEAHLDSATNRLVGLGDEAWAAARDALMEGFAAGESIDDLGARVADAIEVSAARSEVIARTEVISASNAGSLAGARVLGPYGPAEKVWLATVDARTRPSHAEADGQAVPLADTFTVGGAPLDFPGDPAGPAREVINCRCTVIYNEEPGDTPDLSDRQTGGTTASAQEPPVNDPQTFTVPAPPGRGRGTGRFAPAPPPPVDEEPDVVDEPAEGVDDDTIVVPIPPGMEGRLRPFSTIMAVEGRWTGDDRFLLPGSVRWDGMLPLPFTADHEDTVRSVVGLVGEVRRIPGPGEGENLIVGWGLYDMGAEGRPNDIAQTVYDRVESGSLRGVSIRIDDVTVGGVDPTTVADEDDEWWMDVVEDCRLRALSPTPVAAFAECAIFHDPNDVRLTAVDVPAPDNPAVALPHAEAVAAREAAEEEVERAIEDIIGEDVIVIPASAGGLPVDFLVAGAGPSAPPADAFADPGFDRLTPLTVDEPDEHGWRRVYGHLAGWGTCHTGFAGQCITPPHSSAGYASFRTGEVLCRGGERVPVGRLTLGTGHASTHRTVTPAMAAAHYDNTGTAVADVAAGEDAYGIWLAGVVRPGVSDAQVAVMRSSPPSGDWRNIGGRMELIAALHVNVPGFPVARPRARVAGGAPQALVAAGRLDAAGLRRQERQAADPVVAAAVRRIASGIGRSIPTRVAEQAARVIRQTEED